MALLILLLGVASIKNTPTDIFPEIDIPVVTVVWQYTGLSPDQMAKQITTFSEYSAWPGRSSYLDGSGPAHDVFLLTHGPPPLIPKIGPPGNLVN
jgi:hypothetical protein